MDLRNSEMSVSVIIPSFNRCDFLQRAVQSVLVQTRAAFEIIVVDDGSVDSTAMMLKTHYPQVIYHHQPNQGVSAARNLGIQVARGDWLAFLDSDDTWHPEKLHVQLAALTAAPNYRIAHTDEVWMRNGKQVNAAQKYAKHSDWMFEQCLPVCALSPSTVIMHRDILDTVGLFDPDLPACEDYDLWLRISARYPILLVDQRLSTKYAGHENQLSSTCTGLDQYRVKALHKLISSNTLTTDHRRAAVAMLLSKAKIFQQGLLKRDKKTDAVYYQDLLDQYATDCD